MNLAEKALSGLKRDREGRWRWLYRLSVALFLSAVAMPYVVAWLWERDLIVRYRPWEYYSLEKYYLILFMLSIFLLSIYKVLVKRYFYILFFLMSIIFMLNRNSNQELFNKEVSTIVSIGFVYISFLMSFSEKLFHIKMPWRWLIYLWRAFLVVIFVCIFFFLGGYVYSPYPGWYYSPDSGYLNIYNNFIKYRDTFLSDIDRHVKLGVKENKIPKVFLPDDFLCRVEKLYDKMMECAKSNLSYFIKRCAEQEGEGAKIRIYFDRERNGPYVMVYYEGRRLVDTGFYGDFHEERLSSHEVKRITYCRKDERDNGGEVNHER